MFDDSFKPPPTSTNIINPLLNYVGNKLRVEFKRSCLKENGIPFNHRKIVNICIVYEIDRNSDKSSYPALENCLFRAVKLTKYLDIDQYKYSVHGIGFDRKEFFHILVVEMVKM